MQQCNDEKFQVNHMSLKGQVKFVNKDKNQFFSVLKKRVDNYFIENNISKYGNGAMYFKTFALLSVYVLPFVYILLYNPPIWTALLLWFIMGIGMAGCGMSIMHDANHGAYSSNKKVNSLIGGVLYMLGGSPFNWKLQHNILHHTYTNVTHMDEDIADKPMLRFSPHTDVKKVHKYQWLYAFFFYGITTLYWVTAKDFIQFKRYIKNGVANISKGEERMIWFELIFSKVLYFVAFFFIPLYFFNFSFGEILAGFLLMHFVAGATLTIIFQLAHTVEETSHPMPNESGIIENDWAIHQLNTTVNFSRKNRLLSWYVGGLNFQVEHHLFPRISHIHYPQISKIVKATCEEYNVPYLEQETFGSALKSHINFLQQLGKMPDLNEAIG